ncbi:MAG: hypothetical protein P9X24_02290 [Candidatus Hatepunaea meridiana]|nr:hypothetical protein [Candidatus Hatepunaea meridiana]
MFDRLSYHIFYSDEDGGYIADIPDKKEDETMGITYIEGLVKCPIGNQERVEFLVDSGATYSLLP